MEDESTASKYDPEITSSNKANELKNKKEAAHEVKHVKKAWAERGLGHIR